jgi:hypothetical protein
MIAEMMVSKPLILAVSSSTGSERSGNIVGKPRASRFLIAGLVAEEGALREIYPDRAQYQCSIE